MDLLLATRNQGKIDEMRPMLAGVGFNLVNQSETDIPSPVEDGATFVENALIKARAVSAATGLPSIADDSGLVVSALDGAPGIFSARYAGERATDADNNARLLSELASHADRDAYFFCCMVFLRSAQDPDTLDSYRSMAWRNLDGAQRRRRLWLRSAVLGTGTEKKCG